MTKKAYVQPTVAETIIRMEANILTTSPGSSFGFSEDGESGTGELKDEDAKGEGLSRRSNFWD